LCDISFDFFFLYIFAFIIIEEMEVPYLELRSLEALQRKLAKAEASKRKKEKRKQHERFSEPTDRQSTLTVRVAS
jgi:hypothetical protein